MRIGPWQSSLRLALRQRRVTAKAALPWFGTDRLAPFHPRSTSSLPAGSSRNRVRGSQAIRAADATFHQIMVNRGHTSSQENARRSLAQAPFRQDGQHRAHDAAIAGAAAEIAGELLANPRLVRLR